MAMVMEEEDHATVSVRNPSHRFDRPVKIKRSSDSIDDVDSISDLPDQILQHIFSYIPTKFAIRTSVLSKRWRHVWSETPQLSFEWLNVSSKSINKTLASYSASRITSFHLCTRLASRAHHVNSWIEFAMSHKVESLSLEFRGLTTDYSFPDFFYSNSSLKQLIVDSGCNKMIPTCIVAWTSLKSLSLCSCKLSDESFLKILSGCPILESLSLQFCYLVKYLDLSKSMCLTSLEIDFSPSFRPIQIVAPHIHYLRFRNSEPQCTLVDVSSLTEADVDISYILSNGFHRFKPLNPHVLLVMVQTMLEKLQTMLEKLQKVEKLTLGVNFLQILSLSKIPSPPLPTLNVKTLTLETMILRSVVPGIARLLQNSPGLKKITVYNTIKYCCTVVEKCVHSYLDSQDLNPDQCWRLNDAVFPTSSESEVVKPEIMASFMELVLANTKTLERLVVRLGSCIDKTRFEELFQIALTLSHNNKVSIMLK